MIEPGIPDPHADCEIVRSGAALDSGRAAGILVHGRGGTAHGMLQLARAVGHEGLAWIAPQARGGSWYPYSFLAPIEENEPHLSSALEVIERSLSICAEAGVPADRVFLVGFSQGACLAGEFAARRPRRFGGLVMLSGGLIGPPGTPRNYPGSLAGTPAFMGCSDRDPHVPVDRFHESARVLESIGAHVDARIYPGLGHTVNDDELAAVGSLIEAITRGEAG